MTVEMLVAMVQSSNGSLADLRLISMTLLAFSAFLRCDELMKLHAWDVSFAAEHVSISLPKSETDQYRDGATVIVAWSGNQTYPVAILEQYFDRAAMDRSSTGRVF